MPKLEDHQQFAWVRLDNKQIVYMPLWLIPTAIMRDGTFVRTWKEKPDAQAW